MRKMKPEIEEIVRATLAEDVGPFLDEHLGRALPADITEEMVERVIEWRVAVAQWISDQYGDRGDPADRENALDLIHAALMPSGNITMDGEKIDVASRIPEHLNWLPWIANHPSMIEVSARLVDDLIEDVLGKA